MDWQFSKHYTRDEARALLPQIRVWLARLSQGRQQLGAIEDQMSPRLAAAEDLGGELVTRWCRTLAEIQGLVAEFETREIQIKDVDRGLIDFPSFIGGKEVFLCWEQDEEDIEFWHDLASGYAGRERL